MELTIPVLRMGPEWPVQGWAFESQVQDLNLTVGEMFPQGHGALHT